MKHLHIAALAVALPAGFAAACKAQVGAAEASSHAPSGLSERSGFTLAPTPVEGSVDGVPTWGTPFVLAGTSTRVIPHARQKVRWILGDKDHFAEGGDLATETPTWSGSARFVRSDALRWHNAVLQDTATDEQWLLLEERGVISRSWAQTVATEEGDSWVTALVFAVTTEDTNGDGKLDDRDGMRALMTDPDGRAPRYVTPAGTKLASVRIEDDEIFFDVRHDSDGDGEFEDDEWSEPYVLEIEAKGVARPLVSADVRERLRSTLGD